MASASAIAIALVVGFFSGAADAQPGAHGPAAGGVAPHFAAPAPHFAAPPSAVPHFAAPQISAPRISAPHFAPPQVALPHAVTPHIAGPRGAVGRFNAAPLNRHSIAGVPSGSRLARPRLTHRGSGAASRLAGQQGRGPSSGIATRLHGPGANAARRASSQSPNAIGHTARTAQTARGTGRGLFASAAGPADPRNFAAHRQFAGTAALRRFLNHGRHDHHHLGWVGPLFWPYAYGDLFYDALWPVAYADYDPVWDYGYNDIYQGIFSPYSYEQYVRGPRSRQRMAALTQSVAQSCEAEAGEVTGWPIDRIRDVVAPDAQQITLLDDLGNAVVKAGETIRSHCPATVAFTPTGRIAQMQERLDGLVQAVSIVEPALARFYNSLSDEQKARFDAMAAPQGDPKASAPPRLQNPQAACGDNATAFPTDRIDRMLQLSQDQRAKLDALQSAADQAAAAIKAACPDGVPNTPPARLAAEGKRLQVLLDAVRTVRPPLEAFYASLNDNQKAQFNTIGRGLFAQR